METGGNGKAFKYSCDKCHYHTSQLSDFNRHCETIKHKKETAGNGRKTEEIGMIHDVKPSEGHKCRHCNATFASHSGLWKHQKKCTPDTSNSNSIVDLLVSENKKMTDMCYFMMQQKCSHLSEEKLMEFLKSNIIEVMKANSMTNSHNNLSNSHVSNALNTITQNNTFNLQFFLNETCKDALNLSEFVQTIKVTMDDLDNICKKGYVDGIYDVIVSRLNELGVEKRPIHCTDAKRETVYVKENNVWNKEEEALLFLQGMIDAVQKINLRYLPFWRETHPNCLSSSSQYRDQYIKLSQELMGGDCEKVKLHTKDQKIMRKIVREMVFDKTLYLSK